MPIHDGVLQVETFQVTDRGCFDFLGKTKETTKLHDFRDVKLHEEEFLIVCQKRHDGRRAWLDSGK